MNNQDHWENTYLNKRPEQLSWTQAIPTTSLDIIRSFNLPKSANIIDVGGGDSKLVDHLLNEGFENITVLDISAAALDKARQRLGDKAGKVKWVVSDVTAFEPTASFQLWHDRATFHFLTEKIQVEKYIDIARRAVTGYVAIGTFSDKGPVKCSGLPIQQYSEERLSALLQNDFEKLGCITEDHVTPFDTIQNFLFCKFRRRAKRS